MATNESQITKGKLEGTLNSMRRINPMENPKVWRTLHIKYKDCLDELEKQDCPYERIVDYTCIYEAILRSFDRSQQNHFNCGVA